MALDCEHQKSVFVTDDNGDKIEKCVICDSVSIQTLDGDNNE